MAYSLDDLVSDIRGALRADSGPAGREQVRRLLADALRDPGFVAETVGPQSPEGRRTLYEDKDLGFCVLGYVQSTPHRSPPHDHGRSWAVYGQAEEWTEMAEYERAGEDGPLKELKRYKLRPGEAGLFDVGGIHAIDYPAGARFVRVTGEDLEHVPRYLYDTRTGAPKEISSASAS
jgi:predicted metal-dependent enzyme (double-stranded beta helix superfamily)